MSTVLSPIDHLTLSVRQETLVRASLETTFAALLEQLGPGFDTPDGAVMPLTLEAWPGGRWFRDLGDGNGHWWAVVQAIKRPTLLELSGPMFMSYPVSANIQYRLTESRGGTLITFHHLALGLISDEHRQGVDRGWTHIHERVRSRAERR
jgi:Activator of Hsp90 ATPase homolog 1-like protein